MQIGFIDSGVSMLAVTLLCKADIYREMVYYRAPQDTWSV